MSQLTFWLRDQSQRCMHMRQEGMRTNADRPSSLHFVQLPSGLLRQPEIVQHEFKIESQPLVGVPQTQGIGWSRAKSASRNRTNGVKF